MSDILVVERALLTYSIVRKQPFWVILVFLGPQLREGVPAAHRSIISSSYSRNTLLATFHVNKIDLLL